MTLLEEIQMLEDSYESIATAENASEEDIARLPAIRETIIDLRYLLYHRD